MLRVMTSSERHGGDPKKPLRPSAFPNASWHCPMTSTFLMSMNCGPDLPTFAVAETIIVKPAAQRRHDQPGIHELWR